MVDCCKVIHSLFCFGLGFLNCSGFFCLFVGFCEDQRLIWINNPFYASVKQNISISMQRRGKGQWWKQMQRKFHGEKQLYCKGVRQQKQAAKGGCGVSFSVNIQNLPGHDPVHPALGEQGWTRWSPEDLLPTPDVLWFRHHPRFK